MGRSWGWRWERRLVELAMAFNNARYSLLAISKTIVFVFLCLYSLLAVPYKDIAFLLDSSLISCHLPLSASREFAGVGLGKGGWQLERC